MREQVGPPLPFLKSRPPKIQLGGLGSAVKKLPQRGLGRSPSRQTIWCILAWISDICDNNFHNFPENQLTNGSMATLWMIYHARGGLVWGQIRGVWSEVRGSTPLRGLCITYWFCSFTVTCKPTARPARLDAGLALNLPLLITGSYGEYLCLLRAYGFSIVELSVELIQIP